MPLLLHRLSPGSPHDISLLHAVTTLHLDSFLESILYQTIYGATDTSSLPEVVSLNHSRHHTALTTDPNVHYVVVWDPAIPTTTTTTTTSSPSPTPPSTSSTPSPSPSGAQLIAFLKYYTYPTSQQSSSRKDADRSRPWPPGTNIPLVTYFWNAIVESRAPLTGTPHVFIDLLATSPRHQRRGAGKMLMDVACRDADERGLAAALEGSPVAVGLYRNFGFELLPGREGEIWVDLGRFEGGVDRGVDWRGEVGVGKDEKDLDGDGDGSGNGSGKGKEEGWYRQVVMRREARR